jgi:hypothetical protein
MREIRRNSHGHGVPPIVRLARPNWTPRDRRNASATNEYPVFLESSVNCLTHRQKFFGCQESSYGRQSPRRAASERRLTRPCPASKREPAPAPFLDFSLLRLKLCGFAGENCPSRTAARRTASVAFAAGACRIYMASFRSIRSKNKIPPNL